MGQNCNISSDIKLGNLSSGTFRLGATDLESLFNSDLYLVAASETAGEVLRGRLVLQAMSKAHESVQPAVMKASSAAEVAGIAWTNIDGSCALNYQVGRV